MDLNSILQTSFTSLKKTGQTLKYGKPSYSKNLNKKTFTNILSR